MKDSETEVKALALKALNAVINKLPNNKATYLIVQILRGLNNESNKDTKSSIDLSFDPISKNIEYTGFNTNLATIMGQKLKTGWIRPIRIRPENFHKVASYLDLKKSCIYPYLVKIFPTNPDPF